MIKSIKLSNSRVAVIEYKLKPAASEEEIYSPDTPDTRIFECETEITDVLICSPGGMIRFEERDIVDMSSLLKELTKKEKLTKIELIQKSDEDEKEPLPF